MASKRDLVEAHAFNRRRLVTAFVSGAPGGRELEPTRPMGPVWAGVALAVLVVAGSAVAGFLRPGLPNGWDENTLVIARSSGARYLATDGVLFPVANTTSARLLIPADDFRVVLAPDDKIESQPRGESVGIVGAPDALPEPEDLVQSGWTSCVDQRGSTRLRLGARAAAEPVEEGTALLVRTGPELVVISGTNRFRLQTENQPAVLRALGLDGATPLETPGTWVDLFPDATAIGPLTLSGAGQPIPAGAPRPGGATVYGTVLEVDDGGGASRSYVLTPSGVAPLTPLAAQLYAIGSSTRVPDPVRVSQADLATVDTAPALQPAAWPADQLVQLSEPVACGLLTTEVGQLPVVELAVPTEDAALPGERSDAVVEPGGGALVRAVSGGIVNLGIVSLVDATGSRFALGDPVEEVQARLGYADVTAAPVPPAWLDALRDGPELDPEAAQQVISASRAGASAP